MLVKKTTLDGIMIKNLLFDLDDTLFDFHASERESLKDTLVHFGIEPTDEALALYSEVNRGQWKLLELGKTTKPQLKIDRYRIFFERIGVDVEAPVAADFYENRLSRSAILTQGAVELLDALRGKYRLYLITNGFSVIQRGRLAASGIENYFDGIFVSEEMGADKPTLQYFDKCFAAIDGFNRSESLVIGDSLSSDIKGGIAAGVGTVWYNPHGDIAGDIVPDYEIRTLAELEDLLDSID